MSLRQQQLANLSNLTGDLMQYNRLAAAAVFTCLPLAAVAQTTNVQLYGIVDAAVSSEDNGVNGKHTVVNSGNQSSSRFGFRGSEDLGNGLKAIFNLEAGMAIDTGAGDSALFGRRSVVGLEGDFGQLTVGREYSPIAAVAGATDIGGQGFYGSNLSAFGTTSAAAGGRLTRRLSNSINYKSAALSGFKLLAAFSASPNNTEPVTGPNNNLKGVGVEYANGGLYLGGAYHTYKRVAGGDDKEYAIGAGYKFGEVEIKGNWLVADPEAVVKFTQYNLGAGMAFGPGKVFVNLQQNKLATGERGNAIAIDYSYALSKRSNLYTGYAKLRNNTNAAFALNSSSVALAAGAKGADPSVFNLGLRHAF
jgi:predicted porin